MPLNINCDDRAFGQAPRAHHVTVTSVLRRLSHTFASNGSNVIVMVAPAGFGKTMIAHHLAARTEEPAIVDCAGLTTSRALASAVWTASNATFRRSQSVADATHRDASDILEIIRNVWGKADRRRNVIVFDNAEGLASYGDALDLLDELLVLRPPSRDVVIASRVPLWFRDSVRASSTLLTAADLCLTRSEIRTVFLGDLSDHDIDVIENLTLGWPFGTAALAHDLGRLDDRDIPAFISYRARELPRFIHDYSRIALERDRNAPTYAAPFVACNSPAQIERFSDFSRMRRTVPIPGISPLMVRVTTGEVVTATGVVPLTPREREFATYLAIARRPVDRDTILADVIGDTDNAARNRLKVLVNRMRTILGTDAIVRIGRTYTIGPNIETDLEEIDGLIVAPLDSQRRQRLIAHSDAMQKRGRPDWPWFVQHEDRIADAESRVHRLLADDALSRGDAVESLRYARRAVAADPFGEHARLAIVRTYLAIGDLASAEREVTAFTQLVRAELGHDPSPLLAEALIAAGASRHDETLIRRRVVSLKDRT